ncbi:SIMPL domain-containing protein [Candidatus Poribacteria bacterium]|nr:SIMPL domain-containing protein [Candidatus Poribacteria bacterium]
MMRKDYWLLLIAILVIPTLTACDSRLATELLTPSTSGRTINVNGSGSVTGDPDIASLNLGVSVQKETVAEAREDAASSMTALIETLMANNIDEKDISTENFSIYPQYDWTEEGRILKGYRVNNTVRAKVRDLDSLSDVIDDATEAGGDYIVLNSIQFMIEDTTDYQHQARTLAVKNAEAKAQTLAEASGVTLGKPVTISENTYYESPPIPYAAVAESAADDSARSSTPIVPGEQTITVNVTIVYEIQ